jgi:hypothetical protein
MPKMSKETATMGGEFGPVVDRGEDLDAYHVGITLFNADIDATPLLKGLPNDQCQCPHWGYVLTGAVVFRFADHDETYEAGDAFYTPPGHIPVQNEPGTEFVMFSPADELRVTEEAMQRNMQAMGGPGAST